LIFSVCVFTTHVWSIINLLRVVPSLLLMASTSEIIGVVAYTLVFTLLESILILGFVLIASLVFPSKLFKGKFTATMASLVLFTAVWSLPFHFGGTILLFITQFVQGMALIFLIVVFLSLWGTFYIIVLLKLPKSLSSDENLETKVVSFMERLVVLSAIYMVFDILGVIVVSIRNIA
jgi:hypothetical protein